MTGKQYHIYIPWTEFDSYGSFNSLDSSFILFAKSKDGYSIGPTLPNASTSRPVIAMLMTVDPVNGNIYIVFYDRRNNTDNQADVYLAVSRDGGNNFENMRISSAPLSPNSGQFFGDYTNITAYNNIERPIWGTLSCSNTKIIYTAIIGSVYSETITWVGGTSNDWHNPWNWNLRQVPNKNQNVSVPLVTPPNVYPTVNVSGYSCNNLTVAPNATFTISEGTKFTFNGNFTIQN